MIRAALFDLDGVVRRFDVSGLTAIEERHGLETGAILKALLHRDRLDAVVTGKIADEAWRVAAADELGAAGADFLLWDGMAGYVDVEVIELVRRVRERVPIGLLTNATSRLRGDLRKLGIAEEFDVIVNTSEIGFAKPDPRAFAHAVVEFDVEPSDIFFADDTLVNVEAADRLGFIAHRFTSASELERVLRALRLLPD
jgi:FMN phosphatase YigB (HAD superfamily)